MQFLTDTFGEFRSANLRFNLEKSRFALSSFVYLGFEFSGNGIQVEEKRFEIVKNFPKAKNVTQVRRILEYFKYLKRFIHNFAKITAPLRKLLQQDQQFRWTAEYDESLQILKDAVLENAMLAYPVLSQSFIIYIDTGKEGLGHALAQKIDGVERFIAFSGRACRKFERVYGATNLE